MPVAVGQGSFYGAGMDVPATPGHGSFYTAATPGGSFYTNGLGAPVGSRPSGTPSEVPVGASNYWQGYADAVNSLMAGILGGAEAKPAPAPVGTVPANYVATRLPGRPHTARGRLGAPPPQSYVAPPSTGALPLRAPSAPWAPQHSAVPAVVVAGTPLQQPQPASFPATPMHQLPVMAQVSGAPPPLRQPSRAGPVSPLLPQPAASSPMPLGLMQQPQVSAVPPVVDVSRFQSAPPSRAGSIQVPMSPSAPSNRPPLRREWGLEGIVDNMLNYTNGLGEYRRPLTSPAVAQVPTPQQPRSAALSPERSSRLVPGDSFMSDLRPPGRDPSFSAPPNFRALSAFDGRGRARSQDPQPFGPAHVVTGGAVGRSVSVDHAPLRGDFGAAWLGGGSAPGSGPLQSRPSFDRHPPPRHSPSHYGSGMNTMTGLGSLPEDQAWYAPATVPAYGRGPVVEPRLLRVRTSDNQWEQLRFNDGDNVSQIASNFLVRHALNDAFMAGLQNKMRQMSSMQQPVADVDIVDLL
eukprot:TRINITY_DN90541_c0_g1_i1.p1 TRINITY_DN90541_c0_g1~~TRINITY_DN90541_c0_g1_i1.p1  ORF type:complete len:566 (+),score=89.41 TRINITY_DN90541_c0_g1_i1:139-1698(+)